MADVKTLGGTNINEIDVPPALLVNIDANRRTLVVPDHGHVLTAADGLKGQNFSRFAITTTQALTSGTIYFSAFPVTKGMVISNLMYFVSAAASTVTTIKAGLYDSAGTRLAVSANTTTAFDAVGAGSFALSSPYTVTADAVLLAAVISVATGAGTLAGTGGITAGGTAINSGTVFAGTQAGQTDLIASATITVATKPLWVGWS